MSTEERLLAIEARLTALEAVPMVTLTARTNQEAYEHVRDWLQRQTTYKVHSSYLKWIETPTGIHKVYADNMKSWHNLPDHRIMAPRELLRVIRVIYGLPITVRRRVDGKQQRVQQGIYTIEQ